MAGNYWIKFYCEILDDPKMAMLDDHTWRRFYELCLMAGRENRGGLLPTISQMAWLMRIPADGLQDDITALIELGLISATSEGLTVTNFNKRQKPMTDSEKQLRYREKQHAVEYYHNQGVTEPVTSALPKVTQITDNREQITDNRADADVDSGSIISLPVPCIKFAEMAELELPAPADVTAWSNALDHLNASGVTEPIMRQAIAELTAKNYKILGPQSIIKACEVILSQQKRKDKADTRTPDSTGRFAQFINR